jgi:tripartite ATP-independent transporter DctP family solute receptor
MRPIRFLIFCLLAALLAGCGGPSGPLRLELGHVAAPGSLVALSAEEFARRANERLGDRAKVVVFGSSQLGNDEVLLQKLKLGTVDFALPSTIMSSTVDAFGFFEMPYLIKDREHLKRVEEAVFWPHIAPQAEQRGYLILALWENGFRHITNSTRPIYTPKDLQGIKLRTPRGLWRVKLFQTFGANPTPMPLSEVFMALQTGVLDGQENPLTQIHSSKFQETQKYLSITNHVYSPGYLTTGRIGWARLPEDVREIIQTTARETQPFVFETAARLDDELLVKLREEGLEVNLADRESFVKASEAIYKQFGESVIGGREWIDTAIALANP